MAIFKTPISDEAKNLPVLLIVVAIIAMMVLPVPPMLLDGLLALNITASILVLLTSIYVMRPLDFSGLPAVLLVTTLFRLGLNVASTRLILLGAASGGSEVGKIIQTFGNFVVGGNSVVGIIVFLVLVVINFMVITKGAGRIAEVAARFTLDALPGKQMAVDAELAAGALTDEEARTRRKDVQREADFYGAMDGASKFVRGDAIAGLIITGINIVGGLLIGLTSGGLTAGEAFSTYTLLTVGDGLVSQIPALLISTATGIIVTRVASESSFGSEIGGQMFANARVLYGSAGVIAALGLVPGMPLLVFGPVAAAMAGLAYQIDRTAEGEKDEQPKATESGEERPEEEVLKDLLGVDSLALEIGYGLINLVDEAHGATLLDRLVQMRRQFASDLGIVMPPIHIRDNLELEGGEYRLLLKGVPVGGGKLVPGRELAIDPGGVQADIDGIPTKDPTFGLDALWIDESARHRAEAHGYTVVNPETVVITHLSELVRQSASDLFGWDDLEERLEQLRETSSKLAEEVVDRYGRSMLLNVVRRLLVEGISIRDLRTVFEALAGHQGQDPSVSTLVQEVRAALARQISNRYCDHEGVIYAALLERSLEDKLRQCVVTQFGESVLACDLNTAQALFGGIEEAMGEFALRDVEPVILAPPDLRSSLKQFLAQFFPNIDVICHREIVPTAQIVSVAQLGADDHRLAAAE